MIAADISESESEISSARQADLALRRWYASVGSPNVKNLQWVDYDEMIAVINNSVPAWPSCFKFIYTHPVELQDAPYSIGKSYKVPLNYSDVGGDGMPVVAVGGLINVVQRFDFMAIDLKPRLRVIGLEFSGRGTSGWMMELSDYKLDTYVEQLCQLLDFLEIGCCTLFGSSLGGSAILRFAIKFPDRVQRIVLNDSGPYIPLERRSRRANAVGRHYVFQTPSELFRRTGAANRHVGPSPDAVILRNIHHKTRWSEEEAGRIYRHDPRATIAYRYEAVQSLDLWDEWNQLKCPVLLIHGTESDATSTDTIAEMRKHEHFSVIHVEGAGHTPSLGDYELTQHIADWLFADKPLGKDIHIRPAYNPIRVFYPDARHSI